MHFAEDSLSSISVRPTIDRSFSKRSSMMLLNFVTLLIPLTLRVAMEIVWEVSSKDGDDCEEAKGELVVSTGVEEGAFGAPELLLLLLLFLLLLLLLLLIKGTS